MKLLLNVNLYTGSAFISHVVCLDSKISGSWYKCSGPSLMQKFLQFAQNSQCIQNSIFRCRKNIFPNSLINSWIRGNGIIHSLYLTFEMQTTLSYVILLIFMQSYFQQWLGHKLRLGSKVSQFIHWFKTKIFWLLVLDCTSKFFSINKEILGFFNVALAGLFNFSQFMKIMKNCFFYYKPKLCFQIFLSSLKIWETGIF